MDLFPCVGTPLIATMPHFYNADPSLMEKIESGLYPEKSKHEIYIDMETVRWLLHTEMFYNKC